MAEVLGMATQEATHRPGKEGAGGGAGGRWPRQWRLDSVEHGKNQNLPGYPGAPAMEGFGAGML